ncbi:hypothetical protein [Aureimonas sp. ME7]|uniref:hypothetical protein n=1 Tax=Aureimonas sp. ME7 TaxID=2744252 RepID=UPI0015F77C41|nr:hypothetical protein [Aureimonas sp. ME7]
MALTRFLNNHQNRSSERAGLAPPSSNLIQARVLAAGVAKTVSIPSEAAYVLFASTGDFYAKFGTGTVAASVPSGDISDGAASELNPGAREIRQGDDRISLVAPAATTITLSFYRA